MFALREGHILELDNRKSKKEKLVELNFLAY